jgi:hypothetical protein
VPEGRPTQTAEHDPDLLATPPRRVTSSPADRPAVIVAYAMSRRSHRWRGPQGGPASTARAQGTQAASPRPRRDAAPAGPTTRPLLEEATVHVPGPATEPDEPAHQHPTAVALEEPPARVDGEAMDLASQGIVVPAPDGLEPAVRRSQSPQRDVGEDGTADGRSTCTAAQLRRFIRSRPFVPLHELRRRFQVIGDEDDVSPMDVGGRHLFVGLPQREADLLGELLGSGDVGYELLLDPTAPLVVGVFPMRPVARS